MCCKAHAIHLQMIYLRQWRASAARLTPEGDDR
jgi:hypothetical protein